MRQDQYQSQRNNLRQMHIDRMARLKQAQRNKSVQRTDPNPNNIKDNQSKPKPIPKTTKYDKIWLNNLIYDKRSKQHKKQYLNLPNLLNQNVQCPTSIYSKDIQSILITTYGFQDQVFQPLISAKIPLFIYNRMSQDKDGVVYQKYNGYQNVTVLSPPKVYKGYGVFHVKLWLIKFKKFLRVVVSTSNNHVYDWSVWQNGYWYHDCPIKENGQLIGTQFKQGQEMVHKEEEGVKETGDKQEEINKKVEKEQIIDKQKQKVYQLFNFSKKYKQQQNQQKHKKLFNFAQDFIQTLKLVLNTITPKDYNIYQKMKLDLSLYSFQSIKVILIPSLSGRYRDQKLQLFGLGKIKKVMSIYNRFKDPIFTCNSSSIGKLDQAFIKDLYNCFSPHRQSNNLPLSSSFRVVYPTIKYIQKQTCGLIEVLFLTKENHQKCCKKDVFHRYQPSFNSIKGNIPHLKTIIIEDKAQQQHNNAEIFLYLGSHNMTRAAWGTYQKKYHQLFFSNQELGLLFVQYDKEQLLRWLPYNYPPQRYGAEDKPFIRHFQ